jgi:RNA 2',3'-cyclic 3'-phosphodiesterase
MRLFVAVHISEEVRAGLASLQERLRRAQPDVSWVKPANLHITLKFLGETEPKRLERMGPVLAGVAERVAAFSLVVAGAGTFGGRVPRVIWAGVREGAAPLEALARAVEDGLARIGFPKEKRGFAAHLTLGRVRSSRNAESLLGALRNEPSELFGTVVVHRFALMQSELNPSGSVYTELQTFPLSAA